MVGKLVYCDVSALSAVTFPPKGLGHGYLYYFEKYAHCTMTSCKNRRLESGRDRCWCDMTSPPAVDLRDRFVE